MGIIRNARKHRKLVATMILVGASCLGLSFCGSLSSSPNAFSISESHTDINVNLVNGVAIRILNSAATAEITELDLSATAAPTGTFVTDNFKVEVSTANKTGYKLYMNSSYQNPSTSTYTTDLVNQTNTSYTIPTVAAAVSKTDLSTAAPGTTNANKWAYSLDDTTYSPVPANSVQTQIASHDTPTAGTKTPVYIGMNVNVEKPSGVYKNQLTFSAVGNPITTDYSLYFLPGTTETVTGLPPTQTASVVAASHTFTIPTLQQYSPTRDGYNFTGYLDESTSTTYQPGDTITVQGDIDYTGSATLTAQWELASYTITISNTNTSSGSASISVPYGGSNTVTVTPSSGYYLSAVSCPSGFTCSGYSTGASATGTQTVTVTHNGATSGGTLGFVGVHVYTLAQTCNRASSGTTFTYDAIAYVKLGDGNCYTKNSWGMVSWEQAAALCRTGTRLPTRQEYENIVSLYSSYPASFQATTGWSGDRWSADADSADSQLAYTFYSNSSQMYVIPWYKTSLFNVNCIVNL